MFKFLIITLAAAALLGGIGACFTRGSFELPRHIEQHSVIESSEIITNDDDEIRVDIYRPEKEGKNPAVLLLHGSGGIHELGPQQVTRYASTLATLGFTALVVHYFDGTGNFVADYYAEQENYWKWVSDIRAVISWADSLHYVDKNKVSALGISLGGFIGVGVGIVDKRIKRLVVVGGGLEPFLMDSLRHAPPVLMLHGEDDDEVAVAEPRQLLSRMHKMGRQARLVIYPGQGHTLDDSASTDAILRASRFMRR